MWGPAGARLPQVPGLPSGAVGRGGGDGDDVFAVFRVSPFVTPLLGACCERPVAVELLYDRSSGLRGGCEVHPRTRTKNGVGKAGWRAGRGSGTHWSL